MPQLSMHSPVGDLTVSAEDDAIVAVDWGWGRDQEPTPLLKEAIRQLEDYFDGKLTDFDLPLKPEGSDFDRAVWREMLKIPYGETRTYGFVAKLLDAGAQTVGAACGSNPIPVIIPCHRIVGTGNLGGYSGAGGADTKIKLLNLESPPETLPLFAKGNP